MNELPKLSELSKNDLDKLKAINKAYTAFDKTTKGLIPLDYQKKFFMYRERMKEIAGANAFDEAASPKGGTTKPSEDKDKKADKTGETKPKEGTSPTTP